MIFYITTLTVSLLLAIGAQNLLVTQPFLSIVCLLTSLAVCTVGTIVSLFRYNQYVPGARSYGQFRTYQKNLFLNKFFPSYGKPVYTLSFRSVLILSMYTLIFRFHQSPQLGVTYSDLAGTLQMIFLISTVVCFIVCIIFHLREKAIFNRYRE